MNKNFRFLLIGLNILISFSSKSAHSETLDFPPEHCSETWRTFDPQEYTYQSDLDHQYASYLMRMTEKQLIRNQCHKTWTILVYMVAPEDLMNYALADIQEMEDQVKGLELRSDVIVQLDTIENQMSRRLHIFSHPHDRTSPITEAEANKLTLADLRSPFISETKQSLVTTQARRFRDFLRWAMQEYPSEYYMVVIWGHGQGWTSMQVGANFGGLARAESLSYLDIPSLRKVLSEVNSWRGSPIEVFASDACLMESVEDAVELSGGADYVCGSEDIESYAGFPYGALISHLKTGSFDGASQKIKKGRFGYDEPYQVAWMIPQLYKESFEKKTGSQSSLDPGAMYHLTGCTVSSKGITSSLAPSLNDLGHRLKDLILTYPQFKGSLLYLIQHSPSFEGDTQDLGLFLKFLAEWTQGQQNTTERNLKIKFDQIQKSIIKTCNALKYSVVSVALGKDYSQYASTLGCAPMGLSIWLPQSMEEFNSRRADFSESIFYKTSTSTETEPGWRSWMEVLYATEKTKN
jgi:hypothetical protein